MPKAIFKGFKSLDKKSSDVDIGAHVLTQCSNIVLSESLGKVVKDGFYSDVSSTLAGGAISLLSGHTMNELFEFLLSLPSKNEIYVIHATDGNGLKFIYVGQYYDQWVPGAGVGSFNNGFIELTEHIGRFTIGADDITAGTGSNNIVIKDTNPDYTQLSTSNDAYNGWYIHGTLNSLTSTEKFGCIITDYIYSSGAGTKTIIYKAGGTNGIASGDTFSIGRSKLIVAANGASGSGTPKRFGGIQSLNDYFSYLKQSNSVVALTGNDYQFPTQYRMWLGYINRTYGNSVLGNTITFDGFELDIDHLLRPYVDSSPPTNRQSVITCTAFGATSSLTTGTWELYIAFEYDGYKIGPRSNAYSVAITTNQVINVVMELSLLTSKYSGTPLYGPMFDVDDCPPYYDNVLLSKRITAVHLYAKIPGESIEKKVTEANVNFWSATINSPPFIISSFNESDNNVYYDNADGTLTAQIRIENDPTGVSHATDAGKTQLNAVMDFGVAVGSHIVGGKMRTSPRIYSDPIDLVINQQRVGTGEKQDDDLIASIIDGVGNANTSSFANIINLGFFGSRLITGMILSDDRGIDNSPKSRLFIFTEDDYYILDIVSGPSFNYNMDRNGRGEGLIARNSLVKAEGKIFGVSRNGFRVYTSNGAIPIGYGLKDDFDSLSNKESCQATYIKNKSKLIFHFNLDSKTYFVDLLDKEYPMFEYSWSDDFKSIIESFNGDAFALSGSSFYRLNSGPNQAGSYVTPLLKTKVITGADLDGGREGDVINLKKGYVKYKSDTAIELNFYLDRNVSALSIPNVSLPAKSTIGDLAFGFPLGTSCKELTIESTLASGVLSSNTVFQIDEFGFWYTLSKDTKLG